MPWTTRGTKADRETTDEIERQEDRAAAIISAAFFEYRLTLAIKGRLVDKARVVNPLFKGIGPLASFSAKIDLAYLMKILREHERDLLHTIRKIRNEFAHDLSPLSFKSQKITGMFGSLLRIDQIARLKIELEKVAPTLGISDPLDFLEDWLGPITSLPDTPRNLYMNTLKIFLFTLELATHSEIAKKTEEQRESKVFVPAPNESSPDNSSSQHPRRSQTGSHTQRKRARRPRSFSA